MYFSPKEKPLRNLYNILTYIADFHLRLIAIFNDKIKLGVQGRKQTFETIRSNIFAEDKSLWFHCASLGEYEQGLPVFEALKIQYPDHKIVLSFFSPSGYETKKNVAIADAVVYLPLDTKKNARRFLNAIRPDLIVFVKYEIWPNYLFEIKKRGIQSLLISALFRPDQAYFKVHGKWILKAIAAFDRIFVQNDASQQLLEQHGISQVAISGDTRFDRVYKQLSSDNSLDFVRNFKGDQLCIVAGSTWPEDDKFLVNFINSTQETIKFIIAPHNIKSAQIGQLKSLVSKKTILFSEMEGKTLADYQVLILDTIGLLFQTFKYASIAHIGGAIGTTGLHNTLEPAVFGLPIIIGKNYQKFPEAHDMIQAGGMFSVSDQFEFNTVLQNLIDDPEKRRAAGQSNRNYIDKNRGAVIQILDYIRK